MKVQMVVVGLVGLLMATGGAMGADSPGEFPAVVQAPSAPSPTAAHVRESAALEQFQTLHPSIQLYREAGRLNRVYGGVLEVGASPEDTAARFATTHAMMFGTPASDLVAASRSADGRHLQPLMYDQKAGAYKFTLVYYSQYRDGLPVFHSDLRLLVRNEPGYPLVLAASTICNLGDFSADPILANMEFDPASQTKTGMTRFTRLEKVIWAGIDGAETKPVVAVTFVGENERTDAGYECWRFVCDAGTGEILHRETMIHFVDVTGTVKGWATPGAKANICTDEILFNYPWAKVDISGGNTVYADGSGNFTIPNAGSSSVTVRSYVDGLYFTIDNRAGAEETLTTSVTPPGPVNFVHNQANTDQILAQTNIYVAGNQCRDWILLQNPSFPGISTETGVLTVVNRTDVYCPCNAWSSSSDGSINFCLPGTGSCTCPNTAWQSVLNHEYGHHCIDFSSSGQGAYGEGMADCISMLPVDDPNLGYGFCSDCNAGLRTANNTCQYSASSCSSCGSESHDCGQLLSGIVWSIRNQLIVTEPTDYLSILSSIAVNSILVHTGTGINQQIAIDFLTLDDNDGNINNGTPHRTEICAGFSAHGISCPALLTGMSVSPTTNLTATGPVGGPFTPNSVSYTVLNQGPTSPITYNVTKNASWLTITNPTGSLTNGQSATVTVSINSNANSMTEGDYTDAVSFVNTTDHVGDTTRQATLRIGVNDVCANAKTACPGTYTGTTVGATLDGSVSCDGTSPGPDVWYKYTPGSTGSATISLCTSTKWDSVLSIHSGCPGTSSNQLNCSDDDCGGTATHGTITRSVTGGTTYLIRIGGYASTNSGPFTLTITGPACVSADTTPPTPNPMTFATAPAPAGIDSVSMIASTATDPTTPINYFFHIASGSGADSGWQTETTYTNAGLTPNTSYSYQVKARDGVTPTPNQTDYSTPAASTATLIETPTGVSFGMVTTNSIMLNVTGSLSNLTSGTSGVYFNSTTSGGNGGLNVWQQTTTDTATGLSPNTSYMFQVKARNQNSVETAYSVAAAKVTLANVPATPTLSGAARTTLNLDVNAGGNPPATEFAVMCTGSAPTDLNWNGKYVSAVGAAGVLATWRTDAQWAVTTVTGLQACTTYTFAVKARNSESAETVFSSGASSATAGRLGDMNGDGDVDGTDIQPFVTCAISGGSGCACANASISAFVDCLLDVATCP